MASAPWDRDEVEIIQVMPARKSQMRRAVWHNLGLTLFLWDIVIGIPYSYVLTSANKSIFTYLGYEKLMRCPSGILGNRLLFAGVNILLVVAWTLQLGEEQRRVERILVDEADEQLRRVESEGPKRHPKKWLKAGTGDKREDAAGSLKYRRSLKVPSNRAGNPKSVSLEE